MNNMGGYSILYPHERCRVAVARITAASASENAISYFAAYNLLLARPPHSPPLIFRAFKTICGSSSRGLLHNGNKAESTMSGSNKSFITDSELNRHSEPRRRETAPTHSE